MPVTRPDDVMRQLLSVSRSALWLSLFAVSVGAGPSACGGSYLAAPPAAPATAPASAGPISVAVDIRPGLCPNHIRIESPLTIPVAVLGTADIDVANIDPGTVRLSREGFAGECLPETWAYADVGFPVIGSSPDCNNPSGDGLDDLYLCFSIPDVVVALGLGERIGETVPLVLLGKLVTGQGIEGTDYAAVIGGPWEGVGPWGEIGLLGCRWDDYDTSDAAEFKFAYYTNTSDRVILAIYDVRGRLVARLVDMDVAPGIYRTAWSGVGRDSRMVPAGTYFARVSNSQAGETRKIEIPE